MNIIKIGGVINTAIDGGCGHLNVKKSTICVSMVEVLRRVYSYTATIAKLDKEVGYKIRIRSVLECNLRRVTASCCI